MGYYVINNLAVVVNDKRHWYTIGESEDAGNKHTIIKSICQIVKCA